MQREWHDAAREDRGSRSTRSVERYAAAETRVRQRAEERRAAAERALRQQVQRIEQLIERATNAPTPKTYAARSRPARARAARRRSTRRSTLPRARAARAGRAAEGRAGRDRAEAARAARDGRVEAVRERRRPGRADREDRSAARQVQLRPPEGVKPEDIEKAARELHEIQERWKQAAEAPRAQAQALWHRYRQAADPIQAKAREFFAQRGRGAQGQPRAQARAHRARRSAGRVDRLDQDRRRAEEAPGGVAGDRARSRARTPASTWKRFRDACDKFFTRRNADLAQRKEVWSANLAKKEALCARAEELATSREWERAPPRSAGCRPNGRPIGPVRRNKSEALWQRFRTACDTFFDRYKRRDEIELESQAGRSRGARRRARIAGARERSQAGERGTGGRADIAPAAAAAIDNPALLEQVRSLRTRWNQSTPAVRQGADPLSGRFMAALERLMAAYPDAFKGTELDVDANRQKMEKLCERVEGFLTDAAAPPANSSQALAAMLREALASNTIGGRAGEESKWRAMAEDVRAGAGVLDPAGAGARRGGPPARRPLPPRVQPVLRSVPPPRAATAGRGTAADERGRRAVEGQKLVKGRRE